MSLYYKWSHVKKIPTSWQWYDVKLFSISVEKKIAYLYYYSPHVSDNLKQPLPSSLIICHVDVFCLVYVVMSRYAYYILSSSVETLFCIFSPSPVGHLSEGHFRYGYIDFRKPNLYQTNNKTFFSYFAIPWLGENDEGHNNWLSIVIFEFFLFGTFYLKTA